MPEQEIKSFSRFEKNIESLTQLPVLVLKKPITEETGVVDKGVIICGDYIVDDLITYLPDIKKKWFIVSTTQSHVIPRNLGADLHLFSNPDGIQEYLGSQAKDIPFLTLGDGGHFVNPEIFYPDESVEKVIDVYCVAKWSETKRIELIIGAAEQLPTKRFVILGIPVTSERKRAASILYRQRIMEYIVEHGIKNVEFIEPGDEPHQNSDGSIVPGPLSKDEMRVLFQSSRVFILTADTMEGVNRSVCEALLCDVPVVVTADMIGGTPKLVNDETGILVDPNTKNVAEGILKALSGKFNPRENFLKTYGIENANKTLREKIAEIASKNNIKIDTSNIKKYGGDVWSNDFYTDVADEYIKRKYQEVHQIK